MFNNRYKTFLFHKAGNIEKTGRGGNKTFVHVAGRRLRDSELYVRMHLGITFPLVPFDKVLNTCELYRQFEDSVCPRGTLH